MNNTNFYFVAQLLLFSLALFGIHHYILIQFFTGELVIPLWLIYVFNALLVLIVFTALKKRSKNKNIVNVFLILTAIKMALVVVLLLPLFLNKSDHTKVEVFNFFIPYFVFLAFEIFSVNKFLQKG
ncbi:MAG: Uncharacterised protein [Flavobacterium sp. SCGC AAA160-P02]|nr:MAG: Uncharacterised protein [Flavobacterium sp. SCGC AAA160-P02]